MEELPSTWSNSFCLFLLYDSIKIQNTLKSPPSESKTMKRATLLSVLADMFLCFQAADDCAISLTNIIRQHETEYLTSIQVEAYVCLSRIRVYIHTQTQLVKYYILSFSPRFKGLGSYKELFSEINYWYLVIKELSGYVKEKDLFDGDTN
ncbi:hypothetical protein ACET3Z_028364 [Daucus carota]